ncbi:unnamed protein product [Ixodes pacificus]
MCVTILQNLVAEGVAMAQPSRPPPGWKSHPTLLCLKDLDERVSSRLFLASAAHSPWGHLRPSMMLLEYTAHGIPWFMGTCSLIWFVSDRDSEAFYVNLLLALILDLIAVGCIKAIARRRRPPASKNDMFVTVLMDMHSFPSGHVSRVVFLSCVVLYLTSLFGLFKFVFLVWCLAVAASRVLLGRHYVGDVCGGAILGLIEYYVITSVFWMNTETALAFASYFTTFDSLHGGINEVEV